MYHYWVKTKTTWWRSEVWSVRQTHHHSPHSNLASLCGYHHMETYDDTLSKNPIKRRLVVFALESQITPLAPLTYTHLTSHHNPPYQSCLSTIGTSVSPKASTSTTALVTRPPILIPQTLSQRASYVDLYNRFICYISRCANLEGTIP